MRISRKYPLFILLTTAVTSVGILFALLEVLRTSIESEIIKRGETIAQSFALANGPLLLGQTEQQMAQLQYNVVSLAKNRDVLDVRIADHRGIIVAARHEAALKTPLPSRFTAAGAAPVQPEPRLRQYHFCSDIRFGEVDLGTMVLTLSRNPLDQAVASATERALVLASAIAALIALLTLLLVRREVSSLALISRTLRSIAKGDFSKRVQVVRRDEIGDLAQAFNAMLKRAELFFLYVDKMIVDRLVADETLAQPGGRLTELAVIFGDMRGYTAMSNRRTADEVVQIVNTYFHLFIECVAHFGGIVDKTMGDAIMVLFERDDSEDLEHHSRRAVLSLVYQKAANRILNRFLIKTIATGTQTPLEPREFGFAMALGKAIVGNIGSRRRMDYTVCGRVVNLASRLENLTSHGEIIIDNFARLRAGHLLTTEALEPVQPKGYNTHEQVTPHRVLGLAHREEAEMRHFLRGIFNREFVETMLVPTELTGQAKTAWCDEAYLSLQTIINDLPLNHVFLRADSQTSELQMNEPQLIDEDAVVPVP